jgi:phage gpG-like protein
MAATELTLTLDEFGKYMQGLERALNDEIPLDGFFDRAALALKTFSLNCFDQGVDPHGNPWAPVKFRVRDAGGTLQPLRDRGVLMASMTADAAPGAIRERGKTFLRWGTNLIYAAAHQYGAHIVPRRAQFLCLPNTLEALRAGSPMNFPRPLTPRISRSQDTGVLVEELVKGKQQNGPVNQRKGPQSEKPKNPAQPAKPSTPQAAKPEKPKAEKPTEKPRVANDEDIVHYIMVKEVVIPARPFIGYTDKLADKLVMIFDDWLLESKGPYGKFFAA